jgi:hypothetical protein
MATTTQKTAVYNPALKGVMTSDGKLYPTKNAKFMPKGYTEGQGFSSKEGYYVQPTPAKTSSNYKSSSSSLQTQSTASSKNNIIAPTNLKLPTATSATSSIPQRVTLGGPAFSVPQMQNLPSYTAAQFVTQPIRQAEQIAGALGRGAEFGAQRIGLGNVYSEVKPVPIYQKSTFISQPSISQQYQAASKYGPASKAVGSAISTGTSLGAFAVPVAGEVLLASSAARGGVNLFGGSSTKEQKISGALELGTAGLFLGGSAVKGLTKPRDVKIYNLEPKTEGFFVAQPTTYKGESFDQIISGTTRITPRIQTYGTAGQDVGNFLKTTGKKLGLPDAFTTPSPRYVKTLEPRVDISTSPLLSVSSEGKILGRLKPGPGEKPIFLPATVDTFKVAKTKSYTPSTRTSLITGKSTLLTTPKSLPEEAIVSRSNTATQLFSKTSPKGVTRIDLGYGPEGLGLKQSPKLTRSLEIGKNVQMGENIFTKAYSYSVEGKSRLQGIRLKDIDLGGNTPIYKRGEPTLSFFHGTSDKFTSDILKSGLKPSSVTKNYQGIAQPLGFVSTGTDRATAEGFARRTAIKKGGSPVVLEIRIPKSKAKNLLISSDKLSGVGETRFREVPPEFIRKPSSQQLTQKQEKAIGNIFSAQRGSMPKLRDVTSIRSTPSKSQSIFYGKGLYETSIGGRLPSSSSLSSGKVSLFQPQIRSSMNILSTPSSSVTRTRTSETQKSPISFLSATDVGLKTDTRRGTRNISNFLQTPDTSFKQPQIPQQRQPLIQPTPTKQTPTFRTPIITIFNPPNVPITPRPPRPPTPPINPKIKLPSVSNSKTSSNLNVFGRTGRYIPMIRRGGKFKAVGGPTSLERALGIGKSTARGTLGASIRVKKVGGGFVGLNPSQEFMSGKRGRDTTILVQRAPSRLSSRGERSEILISRRGGPKLF